MTDEGEEPANAGDGSPHDTVGISGVTNNYNTHNTVGISGVTKNN